MNEKERINLIKELSDYYDKLVPDEYKPVFYELLYENPEFVSALSFENRSVFLNYLDSLYWGD